MHVFILTHVMTISFKRVCSFKILILYLILPILLYRVMANHATNIEDKEHFLLDGLSQIHLAVSQQEQVVLNAQALISPQQEVKNLQHISSLNIFNVIYSLRGSDKR